MTMITPSYLGETIEYSSLHACRSTLEDPTWADKEIAALFELKADIRERALWRMLYETCARAEEILTLNIEDLLTADKRGRVISKGGAVEWVHWPGTARLLPRLLSGRTHGPIFLTDRKAPARAPTLDVCKTTGRARLSLGHNRAVDGLGEGRHLADGHPALLSPAEERGGGTDFPPPGGK